MAVQHMIQSGAQPITWLQNPLELQCDWARDETYAAVTDFAKEHPDGDDLGIIYAKEMFSAKEGIRKRQRLGNPIYLISKETLS